MALQVVKNEVSGADMIVPTTPLAEAIYQAACCVTTDFENHCAAFSIQQDLLELLELKDATAAAAHVRENADRIEEAFFSGKLEELLKILAA